MRHLTPTLAVTLIALAVPAAGQTARTTPVETTQRASVEVPLRVQLVVSRFQGEKKISSIPYTLAVVANDNDKTSLRMGVDVPVPQSVLKSGEPAGSATSYSYRSVGTNIDCAARTTEPGVFKLDVAIADTAVFATDKGGPSAPTAVPGAPAFRSFTSTFNLLLRDGQTAQHTTATDTVTGEVLRVDVTLTVIK